MHQDAEVQTLPLPIPSSNSSLDRHSRRDHPELQRKLSSFHQDGSTSGDQERRSPFVETPVRHQTVRQDTDTTLRVPERRHRSHLPRETTVRSGIRGTMDDGIFRGGR